MEIVIIFRIILVISGVFFLCVDFLAYAYQRMTETIGLVWGCFAFVLILTGALPVLTSKPKLFNEAIFVLFLVFGIFLAIGLFLLSMTVSRLKHRNQELAMQVSLLNQENERILHELTVLTGKSKSAIS